MANNNIPQWNLTSGFAEVRPSHYLTKVERRFPGNPRQFAQMAESPNLSSNYHRILKAAYDTNDKMKKAEVLRQGKDRLVKLLGEVEV